MVKKTPWYEDGYVGLILLISALVVGLIIKDWNIDSRFKTIIIAIFGLPGGFLSINYRWKIFRELLEKNMYPPRSRH